MRDLADLTRREFLRLGVVAPGMLALAAAGCQSATNRGRDAFAQELSLTPECGANPAITPQQTAGPFFVPNSPERRSLLEAGFSGSRLQLSGYVVSRQCRPVPGALLDFWQADSAGAYDNAGYRFRGHQYTDDDGRYELETAVPGLYPGRTRHLHVRVQAPDSPVLTTQLYFPDEPRNRQDGIFNSALMIAIQAVEDLQRGSFTFVVVAA